MRNKILFLCSIIWFLSSGSAHALNSVTVMADSAISLPMARLARHYSRDEQVIVNTSFEPQKAEEAQITSGGSVDILITPSQPWIDALKLRGLIDVYSPVTVASKDSAHYIAVVIAGDNMDEARKFLEYLKSDDAKQVFKENGFGAD